MQAANRRIAGNIIYMYIRLFASLIIGLYTSRLVLEILGVSDFGLFSVVGGVLALFTFISGSLSSATARFLNTEMGRVGGDVNRCFCVCLALHALLAILILVPAETIGRWYVANRLNVADGKLSDSLFVYQLSVITALVGIASTPFQSLLQAHERFRLLAIVDILGLLVRLCCILMLTLCPQHYALRLYALIYSLTSLLVCGLYVGCCLRIWPHVVRWQMVRVWRYYRDVLQFCNWNLLATFAYMARSSGSDLLLNAAFGTATNGAFAVSKTVHQSIASFTGNFDQASAPQIIRAYAAGDHVRYTYLCHKIGRINLLLFCLICFPLLIRLDYVLHLWLGEVPSGTLSFTALNILVGGVSLSCGGIFNIINASGKIKWFKIETAFFFLLCLPLGAWLFRLGYPAYTLLLLFLLADVVQRAVQLVLLRCLLGFDSWSYVRHAYLRPALIALPMGCLLWAHWRCGVGQGLHPLTVILLCLALTLLLIWTVGLEGGERRRL